MTTPIDITFVDKQTVITAEWLNGVNDVVNGIEPFPNGIVGNLMVVNSGGLSEIDIDSPDGFNSLLSYSTSNGYRWRIGKTAESETGSNAGSNYIVYAYDDSENVIDTPIKIIRAAGGDIDLARPLDLNNNNVSNIGTLDVDGAATFNGSETHNGTATFTARPSIKRAEGAGLGILFQDASNNNQSLIYNPNDGQVLVAVYDGVGGGSPTALTWDRTTGLDLDGKALPVGASAINFGQDDLDYYEEGTSTITLVGKTTAGSHTYADQTLWYSRRGDWVDFQFRITATIDGSWAGEVEIQGLPFPAALTGTIYFDNITRWGYGVNPGDTPTGRIFGSNIPIYVLQSGTGTGIRTANASNFGAGGTLVRLWGSGGYRV